MLVAFVDKSRPPRGIPFFLLLGVVQSAKSVKTISKRGG